MIPVLLVAVVLGMLFGYLVGWVIGFNAGARFQRELLIPKDPK